jgi:hypothetical protein
LGRKKLNKEKLLLSESIVNFICLISRGLRFFIVAYFSYKLGDAFSNFMKTDAAKWFMFLGILIVTIFAVIYFFIK